MNKIVINFLKILGKESSTLSIIISITFTVVLFFYIFTVGSFLKIGIFPFEDRVTYFTFFDAYIISKFVDHLVIVLAFSIWFVFSIASTKVGFLSSIILGLLVGLSVFTNNELPLDLFAIFTLPTIILLFLYNRFTSKKILKSHYELSANYIVIMALGIGLLSLISVSISISLISLDQTIVPNYMYDMILLFSLISPVLIMILLGCYPFKVLIEFLKSVLRIGITYSIPKYNIDFKSKFIYLLIFMLLTASLTLIPHLESINEDDQIIGTDTKYYLRYLESLEESKNTEEFLQRAFTESGFRGGDRPLSLFMILTIAKIGNTDLVDAIEFLPTLLGPALVLTVYFLTREFTSNDVTSLLAAFLTLVSFQTLGGIYAGYYANWLALIFGYMSFVFLIKFLKKSKVYQLIGFSIFVIFMMLSHVVSWAVITVVMVAFLLIMFKLNYYPRKHIVLILLVVITFIFIDLGKSVVMGASGGIETSAAMVTTGPIGFDQFSQRWYNLSLNTTVILGGQLGNIIILGLGAYWLFHCDVRKRYNIFIMVFLSIALVPVLIGVWGVQDRMLYNIPFQIPAAIALTQIIRRPIGPLLLLAVSSWLLALAVRDLSNFYFVSPS